MSTSLRKAIKATNENQSMISSGTELRAKLNHENERFRETVKTMQAKLRGAQMYQNNLVTNKDSSKMLKELRLSSFRSAVRRGHNLVMWKAEPSWKLIV